jgi:hypothetical protein
MENSKIAEAMKKNDKFDPKVFKDFLDKRKVTKQSDYTHTSFKGGKYFIGDDIKDEYLRLYKYYDGKSFGMVEYPKEFGSRYIRFDLDLHFKESTKITKENVINIVGFIKTEINKYYQVDYDVYVLLRKSPTQKNDIYKNGIHIQIPDIVTKNDYITKFIRKELISNNNLINLFNKMEVINPITDIIDECVYTGNGWMQYGSDKGTDSSNAYKVKYVVNKDNEINKYQENNINLVELFSLRNKMKPTDINKIGNDIIEKIYEEDNEIEKNKIIAQEKKKEQIEKRKAERKYDDVVDKDFIKELVGILKETRVHDYKSWSELGWCLKSIDEGLFDLFDKLSQISDKYDGNAVEKFWDKSVAGNYTMGTLRYWAKQDNPEKYDKVCDKYKKYDMSNTLPKVDDDSIAKDFSKRYNNKFIFQDEVMYYFNGIYWEIDNKNRKLKNFIANEYFTELYKILNKRWDKEKKEAKTEAEKDLIDKYYLDLIDIICKPLKRNPYRKNLAECIESYLINDDIEFDTKPYLFCFKNKVWDLTKG